MFPTSNNPLSLFHVVYFGLGYCHETEKEKKTRKNNKNIRVNKLRNHCFDSLLRAAGERVFKCVKVGELETMPGFE